MPHIKNCLTSQFQKRYCQKVNTMDNEQTNIIRETTLFMNLIKIIDISKITHTISRAKTFSLNFYSKILLFSI